MSQSTTSDLTKTLLNMGSGAIAGAISRTITSPMERLKVMQQVQSSANSPYRGIFSGLKYMIKNEGFMSVFKGNGANCIRIIPYSGFQFMFFDLYKKSLVDAGLTQFITKNDNKRALTPGWTLCASSLAASTSSILVYPLDLARSYLSVQTNQRQYNGIMHCLSSIYKAEGIRGLYRGSLITVLGVTPYIAINFFTYDMLKQRYLPAFGDPYFAITTVALGSTAAACAASLTYPSDVLKRRLQLQGVGKSMVADMPKYDGIIDCTRSIIRTEGVRGLYRGLNACLFKVAPSMGISFLIHEQLRNRIKFTY